ncbi:MAG: hypothetical protein GXO98_07565 [Nitrospirae bacterium]|nr:hypothetical protein [Nitrospirota bacterium]
MALFGRFRKKEKRVLAIGLDGTPYSLVRRLTAEGKLPNFSRLLQTGSLNRMNSVLPTVSGVAWSSFMTGKNPAGHGIFGFVDRTTNPWEIFIPTSSHMKAETLWEILGKAGKKVVVMNVPVTYPPREVNGILISGFLATDLSKAVYPQSLYPKLKELGYRIDIDAWKARESKDALMKDLNYTLDKRLETMFYLMDNEPWDFFMCHIMETDRLHHFLWEKMENNDPEYAPQFFNYYQKIDEALGKIEEKLDDNTSLIILSDHGFCSIKQEVQVNYYLKQQGWLKFRNSPAKSLSDIDGESTTAYSFIPGRIFINLKGREPEGKISPGQDYEAVRDELIQSLLEMQDPDTEEKIIKQVYRKEEIYEGPCLEDAADLIAVPFDGYDLKGTLEKDTLTERTPIEGMHTFDDAFLYIKGEEQNREGIAINDCMPIILNLMDISASRTLKESTSRGKD